MSGNTFTASSQQALNSAIETLDSGVAPGDYTINITGDITEGQDGQPPGIDAILVGTGVTVTIEGNHHTLDGVGANGGLAVIGGKVSISDLTIEDTVAQGAAGSGSAGGGAGLGGGLFVGPTAAVTLSNVSFKTDAAQGGDGGTGGGGGTGGHSSLIVPDIGSKGDAGGSGGTGEAGVTGAPGRMSGGTYISGGGPGGTGGPGGSGSAGRQGGLGGDGGTGGDGGHGGMGGAGGVPGGDGGDGGGGGKAGVGGAGGIGGNGAAGGDGGGGGGGGFAGQFFPPGTGTPLPAGGDGATGTVGGRGGVGGFGGGGGAGGDGGGGGGGGFAFQGDGGVGGDGGDGGKAATGGFGGGGGGGGNGGGGGAGGAGANGTLGGTAGDGGDGGHGGQGGFGGGGGGGGGAGMGGGGQGGGGGAGGNVGNGADGDGGKRGLAGFGAGVGASGAKTGGAGGGGLGAGGDIFIAQGGTLTVDGGLLTGGTTTGGTKGGDGALAGDPFGDGIFLQGGTPQDPETITLSAGAGKTLTIDDQIADQTGSGGKGLTGGTGALIIAGSGVVDLDAMNTFVGGIVIQSGTLELSHTGAAGTGPISFDPGAMEFSPSTAPTNPIEDFVAGDTIEITGFAYTGKSYTGSTLTLDGPGGPVTLDMPGLDFADVTFATVDGTTVIGSTQTPCFLAGTHILTERGEVPVEALAVGDRVMTLAGTPQPIVWIGHGRERIARGRRCAATPVLVRKGALGDNVPHRDLRITKGHSLLLDGVLVPAEFLINHRSILWDDLAQTVTFYHVELGSHDVLIAEGAAAESYRDDGNRWLFQNANSGWRAPPKPPCAPVLTGGPLVDAQWRRLLDRAGPGPRPPLTDDPDLHLLADGERIDRLSRQNGSCVFRLRATPRQVRIVSHATVPAELGLARDARSLGVALRGITLRQRAVVRRLTAGDARLALGFHAFEADNGYRWTNGDAIVPATLFAGIEGPAMLELAVAETATYPLLAAA